LRTHTINVVRKSVCSLLNYEPRVRVLLIYVSPLHNIIVGIPRNSKMENDAVWEIVV